MLRSIIVLSFVSLSFIVQPVLAQKKSKVSAAKAEQERLKVEEDAKAKLANDKKAAEEEAKKVQNEAERLKQEADMKVLDDVEKSGFNPYSVRPVHNSDIMFHKSITRAIDLREKQNLPFFSVNREITKFLIEGVQKGLIQAYRNDSLERGKKLTLKEFQDNIKVASEEAELTEEEKEFNKANQSSNWGADGAAAEPAAASGPNFFLPSQLYKLELKEVMFFDKQRSRIYYDIISISLIIPSELNPKGIEISAASFKYKDLVENVFMKNTNAVWVNPQNDREHKNLASAFDLRLFSSRIIKVSNPKDKYLEEIYSETQKQGLLASTWAEMELMEFEHNLWEF